MSTLSTTMKPVQALLQIAAVLVAFVVSMLMSGQASADEVLIFYNSDPDLAISRHDGALITHNSELLVDEVKAANPGVNVRLVPIQSLREVSRSLKEATEKIRGLIFVGHGNPRVFALNTQSDARGSVMASIVGDARAEQLADKLTVYFLGCEMGRSKPGVVNFQEEFFETYTKHFVNRMPVQNRPVVDVIAHTSMSAYKSFQKPNSVQAASYKSGLGRWAENITLNKGFVLPQLHFLMTTTGAAYLSGLDHTSVAAIGASALAALFTKAYVEGGISRYGNQMSSVDGAKHKAQSSIANLLSTSLHADQCQAIFKLRSI